MNTARRITMACIALALFGFAVPTPADQGIPHALGLRMARPSPAMTVDNGTSSLEAFSAGALPPDGRSAGGAKGPFSLASSMPSPMDQGAIGSCGSCATGYAWKSHMEAIARGWSPNSTAHTYSPTYLYNQVNGGGDNGSFFEDNLFLLCARGIASLESQPYSSNFTTWPTQAQCDNARAQRNAYVKKQYIGSTMEVIYPAELKKAKALIAKGTPLLLGISVDDAFDNLDSGATNYVWYPNEINYRGGHAITLIGYDDTISDGAGHVGAFEFQNSWGTGWCLGGRAYIAYDGFYQSDYVGYYAYYGAQRKAYTPTMKANVTISHPKRGDVFIQIGSGSPEKPKWSEWFYYPLVMNDPDGGNTWDESHANISTTLDVTGGAKCWPPSAKNVWWMIVWDYAGDGVSGSITQFQVVGPGGSPEATVPVSMEDSGPTIIYLGAPGSPRVKGVTETTCCDEAAE